MLRTSAAETRAGTTFALLTGMELSAPWVLVVDDDQDACELLCDLISRRGVHARGALDGSEAIAMLDGLSTSELPAVVLTDLFMPGVLGSSVAEYVRTQPRLASVSVAMMTSRPDQAPAGYTVFKKPLDLDALIGFVLARTGNTSIRAHKRPLRK